MPNHSTNMEPQTSRHASGRRTIFFTTAGVLALGAMVFVGLVMFYTWKIAYDGDGDRLAQKFQTEKFTLAFQQHSEGKIKDAQPPIRSQNPSRGEAGAPITIVAFIDFECPFSQQGHAVFERVAKRYEPVARVVFKHFPALAIHPNSMAAANAAACAHEQNKFWELYNSLFATKALGRDELATQAQKIGLDADAFNHCLRAQTYQEVIDADLRDGLALGVRGTPTYFVNDVMIEGVVEEEVWDNILQRKLNAKIKNQKSK